MMDNAPVNGGSMSGLDRIPTHIEGLDENMQGGIPQGHICLVGCIRCDEIEFDIFNVTTLFYMAKQVASISLLSKARSHSGRT